MSAAQQSALSAQAHSGIALVQQKVGTTASGNLLLTVTFDTPVTPGNLVVVCASYPATAAWVNEPSLDVDGVMAVASAQAGASTVANIYALIATSADASVLARLDSIARLNLHCSEWTLIASAEPEDVDSNQGVASATVVAGTVSPASANNLLVAMGAWVADDYSSGPTSEFTRFTPTGGTAVWQEAGYLTRTSAGAKGTGWSLTAGINWAAAIAAFGGT